MLAVDFIKQAHEHQKGKVCTKCKEYKLLSEFYKHKNYKGGLKSDCKSCHKEYNDNRSPFKKWFQAKKSRKCSWEFTIEPEDIPGVKIIDKNKIYKGRKYTSWEAIEYPKVCPILGIELDWGMNGQQHNSPSLDRINPKLGYIKGNVMIMSQLANMMKSNATPEQKRTEARYYLFGNK